MTSTNGVPPIPFSARALYNFVGNHEDELNFSKGQVITVLQVVEGGWWEGQLNNVIGWFPANHIKIINPSSTSNSASSSSYSQAVYNLLESHLKFEDSLNQLLQTSLIPLGSQNILTGKDYDTICGNLHELLQLVKMFTRELTEVYKLSAAQHKFGQSFSNFFNHSKPHLAAYCSNHPLAVRVLSKYSTELDNFVKSVGGNNILDLTAALSQPFRQMEAYSSLLKQVQISIQETHSDYPALTEACRMAESLVTDLEEVRRLKEKELEICSPSTRIENWPSGKLDQQRISDLGPCLLMSPVFLAAEEEQRYNNQPQNKLDCYILQYSDYIVILETTYDPNTYKCQYVISMHELVAHAIDNADHPNSLILTDAEGERFCVYFKSQHTRSLWVKSVQERSAACRAIGGAANKYSRHGAPPHPPPGRPSFMRTEHPPQKHSTLPSMSVATTTGGFSITQLRANPPMTPSEILITSRNNPDAVKSPKVSRKQSKRKSEKIRTEEFAELHNRKTLDCRSLDHDAKIFEVIEAYCQSSQNRMTLHSVTDVTAAAVPGNPKSLEPPANPSVATSPNLSAFQKLNKVGSSLGVTNNSYIKCCSNLSTDSRRPPQLVSHSNISLSSGSSSEPIPAS